MKNKTKLMLFRLPAEILLVVSCLASFLIKSSNSYPLSWWTPITLLVIVVLYFFGRLGKSDPFEF